MDTTDGIFADDSTHPAPEQPGIDRPDKSALSPESVAAQRERLHALKAELLGAEAEEYEDAAQAMDRKEVLQAKHDVDLQRLANIDRALKKIELGTYGLSDVSGKSTPKNRLGASPEAVLTVDEAAAHE